MGCGRQMDKGDTQHPSVIPPCLSSPPPSLHSAAQLSNRAAEQMKLGEAPPALTKEEGFPCLEVR